MVANANGRFCGTLPEPATEKECGFEEQYGTKSKRYRNAPEEKTRPKKGATRGRYNSTNAILGVTKAGGAVAVVVTKEE